MKLINYSNEHDCYLEPKSFSCLPRLPPKASLIRRFLRRIRKYLLISKRHPRTKHRFRSHAAIVAERRRHVHEASFYTIHPYSKFMYYNEFFSFFLWNVLFFKDPLIPAFNAVTIANNLIVVSLVLDAFYFVNIIIWFLTGYLDYKRQIVVLKPRKICRRYLRTYFIFDLLGGLPITYMSSFLFDMKSFKLGFLATFFRLLRLIRLKCMFENMRHFTKRLKLKPEHHEILCLAMLTFYIVHWAACVLYIVAHTIFLVSGEFSKVSWLYITIGDLEVFEQSSLFLKYSNALRMAVSFFYRFDMSETPLGQEEEQMVGIIVMVVGYVYLMYVLTMVLRIFSNLNSSQSKFEEISYEIHMYSRQKGIPNDLEGRILIFYVCKYRKKYFKESSILETLSKGIRYDIFQHTCKPLFKKMPLFEGLTQREMTLIVKQMQIETFVQDDVIMNSAIPTGKFYIILSGSVAILNQNGIEYSHYEEGEFFGELEICDRSRTKIFSYVAVENCQLLTMKQNDFEEHLNNRTFEINLINALQNKIFEWRRIETDLYKAEFEDETVLYLLRTNQILDPKKIRTDITNLYLSDINVS